MTVPPISKTNCNLVTGALGFVGCHLVRSLLWAGLDVVGIGKHDKSEKLPRKFGEFKIGEGHPTLPGSVSYDGPAGTFYYLPLDLHHSEPIRDLVCSIKPVMIYHLAAQSSAAFSFEHPEETFNSNVIGTLNLLEAVRALPQAVHPVVLSVGSCEEYGPQDPSSYPLTEDSPLNPLSPYAVSKVSQTLLCRQYVRAWDLPIIPVRAFSHTGPGQDSRFVFPSFARQIAAAEAGKGPLEILTGDLSVVRDFLHVQDVVSAYRALMKEGTPGEIYNVSSGQPLTIEHGLEIMAGMASCTIKVRQDPALMRPADTPVMLGDNSKLCEITGWQPEWDLAYTLGSLLEEARKEHS